MRFTLLFLLVCLNLSAQDETDESFVRLNPEKPTLFLLGQAPEFKDLTTWLNSPPLEIASLKGKVVLIEFWTYSCINCLRTIPFMNKWYEGYKDKGLVVIGIHTPEYAFEKEEENVKQALLRYAIKYPVALDNGYYTWNEYKNRFWPTSFLIDKEGRIRKRIVGEGHYQEIEQAIQSLLALPQIATKPSTTSPFQVLTPEIHLGFQRAQNYDIALKIEPNKISTYNHLDTKLPNTIGLKGSWDMRADSIKAVGETCAISLSFISEKVYIVLSGASERPVQVLLDGAPVPKKYYTQDMDAQGDIFVESDRKYDLVDLHGKNERHRLTVIVPPGISVYEFSFGP